MAFEHERNPAMSPNDAPFPQGPDDGPIRFPPGRKWIWIIPVVLVVLGIPGVLYLGVSASSAVTDACHDQGDGAIDITASSGAGSPTFEWSSPTDPAFFSDPMKAHQEDQAGLPAGTYRVKISNGLPFGSKTLTIVVGDDACPPCPAPYFEAIGDLPGDNRHESAPSDISADGARVVGSSSAFDPAVPTSGENTCVHWPEAMGYIRPCKVERFFPALGANDIPFPLGNNGTGLLGLGFLPGAVLHSESLADGISPDGKAVVGYATTGEGNCGIPKAVLFTGISCEILTLPDDRDYTASRARDISDPVSTDPPNGTATGRVIVGYATTNPNMQHAHRYAGAHALYWDASGTPHELPEPTVPGVAIVSVEALSIADDASAIMGNAYSGANEAMVGHPCVWRSDGANGYVVEAVLDDVPDGSEGIWGMQLSGDGATVVGVANFTMTVYDRSWAVRWQRSAGSWGHAEVLPEYNYMTRSAATGVSRDGSVIVGYCYAGWYPWLPPTEALVWQGTASVSDVATILRKATPPVNVPACWYLEATRVSADGRTVTGFAHIPQPGADDPFAVWKEAWVAGLP